MRRLLRRLLRGVAVVTFATTPSYASDHSDGPRTGIDLAGDLTDLFVFTSPKDPAKLVMILNANGFAGPSSLFSDAIDYSFRIRPIDDPKTLVPSADPAREQSIVCSFTGGVPLIDAKQRATCKLSLRSGTQSVAFDTRSAAFKAGGTSGDQNGVRIFAGIRSDPWFADVGKIGDFDKGVRVTRANASNSVLQGKNVLSIVVEIDKARVGGPLLAVTAQTVRRSGL